MHSSARSKEVSTYVPVKIMSPGNSVVPRLKKATVSATPKIRSPVSLCCTVSPFSRVSMRKPDGEWPGNALATTMPGPKGAQASKPLPRDHWPVSSASLISEMFQNPDLPLFFQQRMMTDGVGASSGAKY